MDTRFKWSLAKAQSNLRKHRLSFETATRVFFDPFAVVVQDRIENGERRWQTLGIVDGTEIIRIISARRAESKERKHYEKNCPL